MQKLSHEKLEVYQRAIDFLAICVEIIDRLEKGHATIKDQLKRASQSTVLNIAEAAGYPSRSKSKHHFSIARGSALECGAALDIINLATNMDKKLLVTSKEKLVPVVAMLSKMSRD